MEATFLSLGLLIGVARFLGELSRRFHQPAVLGELLAGVLLGPTVLGTFAPAAQEFLFPKVGHHAVVLDGISSFAIALFLLVAGMEVDLSIVWKQGRSALKVGILGTIVPFCLGLAGAWLIPQTFGRAPDAAPVVFALFLATAMAISALPVIARTLMDLDLYRTDLGMVVISAAIFNDLIGWTVFALILGMIGPQQAGHSGIAFTLGLTLLFVAFMLTIGRWLIHRVLPFIQAYSHYPGGVMGFAVAAGLLGGAVTEQIGIHAIFGAFLVGVALGDSSHLSERTRVMLDEFVSFILAPVFFAGIGLKVNFIAYFDITVVLPVLGLTIAGKLLGATLGAQWAGFQLREQWAIAFGMTATGAMGIILGTTALEAGVIGQPLFVAIVVTAIVTSGISGPLIRRVLERPQPRRLLASLSSKLFVRNLRAASRRDSIRELAAVAAQQSGLDAVEIERLAWNREQLAATGIGNGVAIPNARVEGTMDPVLIVGFSEAGLPFNAPDGMPAHVIFLLVTSRTNSTDQLELSADISHTFRDPHRLERVLRAENFTEFLAALKVTRK